MPKRPAHPLIFTDLDGTLLDHESYSAKPADLLIEQIIGQSIGSVIPITSKTRAELRLSLFRKALSLKILRDRNMSSLDSDMERFWSGSRLCPRLCDSRLEDLRICPQQRFHKPRA